MTEPIEVYFWPTPNGHKITITLEEMGLPYRIVPVNIGGGDQFKPDFLAISPNNRMPAIVDPDGPGGESISVFESGAIMQYLGRKTGRFYPTDERARVEVDEWVHWQMANLGPNAGQRNHFRMFAPTFIFDQRQIAYGAVRYTNEVNRIYGVLDRRLEGRDFITGEYSIADIISWPWIFARDGQGVVIEKFPNLRAWHERIGERPAVKRALEAGAQIRTPAVRDEQARKILYGQRPKA